MKHLIQASLTTVALSTLMACGQPGVAAAPQAREAERPAVRTAPVAIALGLVSAEAPLARTFTVSRAGEGILELKAAVPGADWESVGREAATLRLSIDGTYNQDIVLHQGETPFVYRRGLGHLEPGTHTLTLERLGEYSAPGLTDIRVEGGEVTVVPPESGDYEVLAHAPILFTRDDAHRTDTPVALYHEILSYARGGSSIKYTLMISNEDAGTATRDLMGRWGRAIDIDWLYQIRRDATGETMAETYQGVLHFTRSFKGEHEARHPMLRVASRNNIFDDKPEGPIKLRLLPDQRLDAALDPREDVLDRLPWLYKLNAKELFRERKAAKDFYTPSPQLGDGMIADPRRFLYLDFHQVSSGRGVAVAVKLKNYPEPFFSHRGDGDNSARRSGWCRVAVELPRPVKLEDIERIEMLGPGGRGSATVTAVRAATTLAPDFMPTASPIRWKGEGHLHNDEDRVTVYDATPVP